MRYDPIFIFLIGILSNAMVSSSTITSLFTTTTTTAEQTTSTRRQLDHSSLRLRDKQVYSHQQDDISYAINEQNVRDNVEPLPTQKIHDSSGGRETPKQLRRYDQERRPQSPLPVETKKYLSSTKEKAPVVQERRVEENSVTKLFSTPINEWSIEQFALFLVLIMFIFICFGCVCCGSCCGGGGGGGSCCADILACWCCYECCCDDGAGIPYGVFA